MPHTNRKSNVPPPFKPAVFVNCPLTDDDKARIKAAPLELQQLSDSLSAIMADGYKLTVKYDQRNDSFAAWLIPPDKEPNKGLILSGRGSTPVKAVKQVLYIHLVIYEGDWSEGVNQETAAIDD